MKIFNFTYSNLYITWVRIQRNVFPVVVSDLCETLMPCVHGSCRDTGPGAYECDCTGTGYTGVNCSVGMKTVKQSPDKVA